MSSHPHKRPSKPWSTLTLSAASSIVLFLSLGIRSILGLFVGPISKDLNWGRSPISLAIGLGLLFWGLTQPFLCAYADSYNASTLVLLLGGVVYAAGIAFLATAGMAGITQPVVVITVGLFIGTGAGATGMSLVLAILGRRYEKDQSGRLIVFAVVSALSQLGTFALSPATQAIIGRYGWRAAAWTLCGLCFVMCPLAFIVGGGDRSGYPSASSEANADQEETHENDGVQLEPVSSNGKPGLSQQESHTHEVDVKPALSSSGSSLYSEMPLIHGKHAQQPGFLTARDDVGTIVLTPNTSTDPEDHIKSPSLAFAVETKSKSQVDNLEEESSNVAGDSTEKLASTKTNAPNNLTAAIRQALTSRPFILITAAFFVCGWHIGFIATHLPSFAIDAGINASLSSWTLSLIGLTSTIGTASAGYLPRWFGWRVKQVLAMLYAVRAVLITIFLVVVARVSDGGSEEAVGAVVMIYSILFGFVWLTTVPLTTGLISDIYGTRYLATLSAINFSSHQVGSFFGSWLGGVEYDATSRLVVCWWTSVGLAVASASLHLLVDDTPLNS
ncbi:hypothetical protein HDU76_001210 [Blyttiomyces sp. JEL0837]|nr:hypothetical protein HDU76_001210 [Blyttiomyces sp. JEL0837]